MTHICISKLTIIGSDNGLSPGQRQAIVWTNAGILLISSGPLGTNFSEILIKIHIVSFKKMHLETWSAKWWPFFLGLNVLEAVRVITTPVTAQDKMASFFCSGNPTLANLPVSRWSHGKSH